MDYSGGPVLVLGATGYVGGRLVPRLLELGYRVRAVGRSERKIAARRWGKHPNLEIVAADARNSDALARAMQGCKVVFYLIHSIRPGEEDFATLDRHIAYSTVQAARQAGVEWIIHFTGLGNPNHLSAQLQARYEVGEILALGGAKVTQLRAPLVLGSGGASFEMIRAFCGYLRVMFAPRWMDARCQPIAISNVIDYLAGCLSHPETIGKVYEIGGPDVLTWRELFHLYSEEAGLPRRLVLVLPLRIHRISIWWMNLVTPVSVALIRPLVERMRDEVLCRDHRIREIIPLKLLSSRDAITTALKEVFLEQVASSCYDAGSTDLPDWESAEGAESGSAGLKGSSESTTNSPNSTNSTNTPTGANNAVVHRDIFSITLDGPPQQAWDVVKRIGGDNGWYFGTFLWQVRGFVDEIIGGPGLSRGRRHLDEVTLGDHLDFWRVVAVEEQRHLLLRAEMLAPGDAFLEFRIHQLESGGTELRMIPSFRPRGFWGMIYWWMIAPSHLVLFGTMLKQMARAAKVRILAGPSRLKA